MASPPGEMPAFDFGPERTYNAELVAERIMWPLVDELWRGNWRKESEHGPPFVFPKKREYEGKLLYVLLEATCNDWADGDDEESSTLQVVNLYIEEVASDENRTRVLEAARVAADEAAKYFTDVDDIWKWPEGDERHFLVKTGVQYSFDTDNSWNIELYRVVEGERDCLKVPLCEAEIEGFYEDRLRLHDIENIQKGCIALGASKLIIKALEEAKTHSIDSY